MKRFLLMLIILLLFAFASASADGSVVLKTSGEYHSFYANEFLISVPSDGLTDISVESLGTVLYAVPDVPVTEGENVWQWDGLAWQGEPLPRGEYDLTVRFRGDGESVTEVLPFPMGRPKQALLYVLPQSDTVYLGGHPNLLVQFEMTVPGKLVMELANVDSPDEPVARLRFATEGGTDRIHWNIKDERSKLLPPGRYTVRCYPSSAPSCVKAFELELIEGTAPVYEVKETGPIMPSRYAEDGEIWALMTAPAVVFSNGEGAGNPIYESPSVRSEKLGFVHGTGTALEVIHFTEDRQWAYVGAWSLTGGKYIEGYVPASGLTVVLPAQDYGLLVDKQTQTLTLFDHGKRAGTVRVSTGLQVSRETVDQETQAGSYLTVSRLADFSNGGFSYDYPIRYNGANLIHSLGFKGKNGKRDYSIETALLGQRASHGCIRVEHFTDGSPLNAWWLWTHLRWNTRVIILDNPADRAESWRTYGNGREDMPYTGTGTNSWD